MCLNKDELYSGIELGIINLDNLKKFSAEQHPKRYQILDLKFIGSRRNKRAEAVSRKIDAGVPFLLRENVENAGQSYEIAKCCNPIPGDEVTGYLSPEGPVIIHKQNARCDKVNVK